MRMWILYAYDDPDEAPVLESFHEADEAKPTQSYIDRVHGHGVLYECDVVDGQLVNERACVPERS